MAFRRRTAGYRARIRRKARQTPRLRRVALGRNTSRRAAHPHSRRLARPAVCACSASCRRLPAMLRANEALRVVRESLPCQGSAEHKNGSGKRCGRDARRTYAQGIARLARYPPHADRHSTHHTSTHTPPTSTRRANTRKMGKLKIRLLTVATRKIWYNTRHLRALCLGMVTQLANIKENRR